MQGCGGQGAVPSCGAGNELGSSEGSSLEGTKPGGML